MLISRLDNERDRHPRAVSLTWAELVTLLSTPIACSCTVATCGKGENEHVWIDAKGKERRGGCRHKYGAAWSPAAWPQGETRAKATVGSVGVLVIDLDHHTREMMGEAVARLIRAGVRFLMHSSHSNEYPNAEGVIEYAARVIVELSEPVLGADWPRFWQTAIDELAPGADPAPKDASRLYFLPSHRADATFSFDAVEGKPLDVRGVLARAPAPEVVDAPAATEGSLGPASPELIERARQRLRANGPAIEGQGGDQKTYSVCAALLHDYALTDAEAWPLLVEWNETCKPPWDLDELKTKMANGRAYAEGPYGAGRLEFDAQDALRLLLGVEDTPAIVDAAGDIDPDPPSEASIDDALTAYSVLAGLGADVDPEPVGEPGTWAYELPKARKDVARALGGSETVASTPLFSTAADLFAPGATFNTTPWLMRGMLVEGGVQTIVSGPKSAKSWMALEMCLAVASGAPGFADKCAVPAARKCAYFFAEDMALSVRNHIRAFAAGRKVEPGSFAKNLYVCPRGQHLDITRDEDLARVIASCRMIGKIDLLVLDPLRDVHTGKENESDDMSAVFARLRTIVNILGCAVLAPHHAKKPSKDAAADRPGDAARGSSAIYGALDGIIGLTDVEREIDDTSRQTVIAATVVSEFKAARAYAPFRLLLTITDDEYDQSIHAVWSHKTITETNAEEAAASAGEPAVLELAVEFCEYLARIEARGTACPSMEKIRGEMKCGRNLLFAAKAHAAAKMWIQSNEAGKCWVTPTGKEMLRKANERPAESGSSLDDIITE